MAKIIAWLLAGCLIVTLFVLVATWRRPGSLRTETFNSPLVIKEIRQLNQLATVSFSVEKVVGMKEERSPVGTESILLLVHGKVLAGINLSDLKPDDVTAQGRSGVSIRLDPPQIQEAFLDEKYTKVWDRSITWWTPWITPDLDLEHRARLHAVDDIRQAALDMGILKEARRNAETSIRVLLQAFGIENTSFSYGS
jgi:Protein of unknown function (DUF4230)